MQSLVDNRINKADRKQWRRDKVQNIIKIMKSDDRFEIDDSNDVGENDPLVESIKEKSAHSCGCIALMLVGLIVFIVIAFQ